MFFFFLKTLYDFFWKSKIFLVMEELCETHSKRHQIILKKVFTVKLYNNIKSMIEQ